ncbi:MAG: alpha/beta hydrolase [Cyanobacteria bacterium P01_A01_bin.135]
MAKIDVLGTLHTYDLTAARDGACLVFVHGWLLSREYWYPLTQQLQAEHTCLLYDLRGFGDSQPSVMGGEHSGGSQANNNQANGNQPSFFNGAPLPNPARGGDIGGEPPDLQPTPSRYSPAAYAQDLLQLMDGLGIERAWVIGHSLGGSIGLWAAFQAPERICGCICVNSGGGIYLKEEFETFRGVGQQLVRLRPKWLRRLPFLDLAMARMNVARPLQKRWGRQRLLDLLAADAEAAMGSLLDSTTEAEVHRLPHVVSHLSQPVYFIAGDQDDIMEPKYVNHLASFHYLFKNTGHNVVELENCGHFAMIEQPDALAATILSILQQHSNPTL